MHHENDDNLYIELLSSHRVATNVDHLQQLNFFSTQIEFEQFIAY